MQRFAYLDGKDGGGLPSLVTYDKVVRFMMEQTLALSALGGGQTAVITSVHGKGAMGARLRDLGFTEQSTVTCLYASAFGDPRAYRVKDTVIALRRADACCIGCHCTGGAR
ncbi:MAG: FeoA family protein [Clostridia bacterium]